MSWSLKPREASARRRLTAAAAAVIPVVPIAIAITLSGAGAATRVKTTAPPSPFIPITPIGRLASPNLPLPPGRDPLVATVQHPTMMRSSPGGHAYASVGTRTEFGSPQTLLVVRRSGGWLGVVSASAGNNRVGWIPAAEASLSRVGWQLKVSLSARRLTVLRGGRPVAAYTIAVGAPAAPTPTGRFAVTDRLDTRDPGGPYGCCILALSAKAPHAIQGWTGGNRIAIHSTPDTASIGLAVSHGCMRLTLAEGRWLLRHIPLGTPTLISS